MKQLNWHADRQLGLFTRAQASGAGFKSGAIDNRLSTGRWRRWHPGVYSYAGLPETWETRLMAALLAVGDDAVVGGLSAGCLWKLPDIEEGPLQLVVPRTKLPDLEGVTLLGTRTLENAETTRIGRLPITTATRTLRDLARLIDRGQLLECAAEAWRRRLTDPDRIAADLAAHPRWPGNGELHWVLRQLDPQYRRCRSVAEIRSHRALRSAGCTGYVINARLTLSSGRGVEVDVLWARTKRIVEIDGETFHGGVTARRRDAARDGDLEADGYRVLRVPASLLDDPRAYVEQVRAFLAAP